MINYTKKDQDFHGIFKLVSGEEVLAKAVITEDGGECLVFMQDPVVIHTITNPISENKVMRGMGFTKWMPMSDEDFFIVRDRDIVTMQKQLSQNLKKEADLTVEVDKSLIGGAKFRIENKFLDASIKSQLKNIKLDLMKI